MQPVFRFAPSPNGYLHLGHAYSALLNADLAAASGGRLLLRIEDIDAARCKPEFEAAIYEDLDWLGVPYERPVRRQSDHLAAYSDALARLAARGLIYPAFESRGDIARWVVEREAATGVAWPRDPDGGIRYPGLSKILRAGEPERLIAAGAPYALRIDMEKAVAAATSVAGPLRWNEQGRLVDADLAAWGDVILARKDVPNSYHLSVVVDDAAQGVTHVVRGEDLYPSTSAHRLLQRLLDFTEPVYRHHKLVLDDEGRKLSKSTQSTALRTLRAEGATPQDIRRLCGLD